MSCNITTVTLPYSQDSGSLNHCNRGMCCFYHVSGGGSPGRCPNCPANCFLCSFVCDVRANNTLCSYSIDGQACFISNVCSCITFSGNKLCTVTYFVCTCVDVVNTTDCCTLFNCCKSCSFCFAAATCNKVFTINACADVTLPQSFNTDPWCLLTYSRVCFVSLNQSSIGNNVPNITAEYTCFYQDNVSWNCEVMCGGNFGNFYVPCCVVICRECVATALNVDCYYISNGVACFTANTCNYINLIGHRTCTLTHFTDLTINLLNESGCSCQLYNSCCADTFVFPCCCTCCGTPCCIRFDDTFSVTLPSSYANECWCVQTCALYCVTSFGWVSHGEGTVGDAVSFKIPIPFTGLAFSFEF